MFFNVELITVGFAAVLETALLAALLERRNRRQIALWTVLILVGAWLWHSATFAYALLAEPRGQLRREIQWLAMTGMVAGLLLMPSALLHGAGRLWRSGAAMSPPWRPAYVVCYLPVGLIVPLAWQLRGGQSPSFLGQLDAYIIPYVAWVSWVNLLSAGTALRFSFKMEAPHVRRFLRWFSGMLLAITAATAFLMLLARPGHPGLANWFALIVALMPALPALLFAYFVIRFQFLSVVLERALVYGAIAACLMLFHQVALQDLASNLSARYRIDFGILEMAAGIGLIVLYEPLRQRAAEALRYFMGSRASALRDRTRELSVQMSQRAAEPAEKLLAWFTAAARDSLRADCAAAWLFSPSGGVWLKAGPARLPDERAVELHDALAAARLAVCADYEAPTDTAAAAMLQSGSAWAFRIDHPGVRGLLLLGPSPWSCRPGNEELNSFVLLVEQLGSTIHSGRLQAERLSLERFAHQNEKLATLGLMAGSIAHEIKNPLSSIKTLATVASEQLDRSSPLGEDLRLIVEEVDRLSATTSQLLEFARPQPISRTCCSVTLLLERLLRLMRHLAAQKQIGLELKSNGSLPPVAATDAALQEIFFNLLTNAIEATGRGGKIHVASESENGCVNVTIADTGRGISPELQASLFEPFVTGREMGTGLGLHIVGQRVRELRGEICCRSAPEQGTEFIVRLPVATPEAQPSEDQSVRNHQPKTS